MKTLLLAFAFAMASSSALAADFDGSKRLICATQEAMDCGPGETCTKGLPDDIGAPTFIRIDFAQKALIGPKRTTPIRFMEKTDQQLVLQGTELGHAWTLVIDQDNGNLSATLADRDGVFVLFGACTVP